MKKRPDFDIKGRHFLSVMAILCIGLIALTAGSDRVSGPVRNIAGYVITPFQNGVNRIGGWFTGELQGFRDVKALSEENASLKEEISQLTLKNNELVQNQTELVRLRSLYQMDKKYSEYDKVAAEVISKDPGNWYSTFVVNRGSKDGIAVDMNVLGAGGLIGIVTEVGANWAQIRSIVDDESHISAMASNTSEPCVVNGNLLMMDTGKIAFSGLRDGDNQVTEGTSIVTSNISDKYLTGILIGYVSDIALDANNLTKSGTIIPAADFRNIREVLIITEQKTERESE
ncbi:MAG: rod shape-determining protein MreC [Lachnospiraceae bacterium]|nr:rod shape-determining protein MreC [Lachnospiraceae bacterium]